MHRRWLLSHPAAALVTALTLTLIASLTRPVQAATNEAWIPAPPVAPPGRFATPATLSTNQPTGPGGPRNPAQELATFDLEPGLRMELVAAEPLIVAPSAFAWEESGALFVAENRGYPLGGTNGLPVGRIARLTDTNGDGLPDRRTEFATGLTFPNGLLPWRGGLLVTCAPDVWYFKDTDGDGQADLREVVLTGFATNQTSQLRVNKPQLAPDGWVYLASGLSGGRITSPKRIGDAPLELRGDVRFNPDTGEYQAVDGRAQFGQDFDDFGRRFACYNRVQVQHFVTESGWFARHPGVIPPEVLHNCPERIDNPWLRGGGGAARLFPISRNLTTADSHAGTFSAACAITLWSGGDLPDRYTNGVFSCDPTANLVHFDRLEPRQLTFAALRLPGTNEFLRSTDDWFRPVYLGVGPDGALYVADMYRKTIEHPEYLPVEIRKRTDFTSGSELGRLWRVRAQASTAARAGVLRPKSDGSRAGTIRRDPVPTGVRAAAAAPGGWDDPAFLLTELGSTNRWRRDTAFRRLREGGERDLLTGPLRIGLGAARTGRTASLFLHLLAYYDGLDPQVLTAVQQAPDPEIRELGIRFATPGLAENAELARLVASRARDEHPRVRFQAALSLGELASVAPQVAIPALTQVAARDGRDAWVRAAILSSVPGQERSLLTALLAQAPQADDPILPLLRDLGELLGRTVPPEAYREVFAAVFEGPGADLGRSLALLAPFTELASARTNLNFDLVAAAAGGTTTAKWQVLKEATLGSFDQPGLTPGQRLAAIQLTGQLDPVLTHPRLLNLLRQETDPLLLNAALRQLLDARSPTNANPARLLSPAQWDPLPPATRLLVLEALVRQPSLHGLLADALEQQRIPPALLTSAQRETLRRGQEPQTRARLGRLLATASLPERRASLEAARAALALKPVAAQGRAVFRQHCASCHRLEREGQAVGPDLFDIRNQPKETLLLHLVIPEQEIAPNFAQYLCTTTEGRTVGGLLVSDGPAGVVLRQAQGVTETIPRSKVLRLELSPLSLMPQGFEQVLKPQELADLLAFLKGEP
jgi:putative membrane-bound dehydrogenase-like protein